MHEEYDESDQREFGDIGTYIEDVDRMITNITYSGSIFASSGPKCPRNDGGCGGQVVRLETIWLTNSDRGKPLNDLGRVSAPPRKPRFRKREPSPPNPPLPPQEPHQYFRRSSAPAIDLDELRQRRKKETVRAVFVTGILSLLFAVCMSDLLSPDSFSWGFLVVPLIAVAVALALGRVSYQSAVRNHQKAQETQSRREHQDHLASIERSREAFEYSNERYRERTAQYERELADFKASERRHERLLRRFERLHRIWAGSWSCAQCGRRWRAEKIDRADFTEL